MANSESASAASEAFRHNLSEAREAAGITPASLAEQMTERGFPFHRQTVQRIESGERSVKLDEALALAELLGERLDCMVGSERTRVLRDAEDLARRFSDLGDSAGRLMLTQYELALACDILVASGTFSAPELRSANEALGITLSDVMLDATESMLAKWPEQRHSSAEGQFVAYWRESRRLTEEHGSGVDQ